MTQGKILLVDDEEIVLETMSDDLREVGFNVAQASNGSEGLRQFVSGEFDLVISDLMMGETDGFEVLREIKKISPETPVVIITGYPSKKVSQEAMALGASDVIVKPFGLEGILEVVNQHIRSSRSG
jgi:CheY-like chemotaxis protein